MYEELHLSARSDRTPLLEVKGISKAFPGVQALKDVDFEVYPGEVVALIGENGAGKSTLIKILSGAYRSDAGTMRLGGEPFDPKDPRHAQQQGIAVIYQEFNLTPNQDVATNIFLGREPDASGPLRLLSVVSRSKMERETRRLLETLGANFSPRALVQNLSVAEQQMVEIAKALSMDARVIIMDEPTSALGDDEVRVLFELVGRLRERGLGIIFISHRLDEVFTIADRIVVLRDGERVGELSIDEATHDKVIGLMVGRDIRDVFQKKQVTPGEVVLEARGLTRRGVIEDISFTLRRGEILGVAGLVGSGRTEIARALFGADPLDAGEVLIDGQPVEIRSPADAVRAGLALVPEDRKEDGLILMQSVRENITLPNLDTLSASFGVIQRDKANELAARYVDRLTIRTPSLRQRVEYLSGGNQQKTVLAKWLASNPKVLILDEPTRGIDVGAKSEVHALMSQLAGMGIGIIMISSELPEILGMSDRILVVAEGRITAVLDASEATQETIMAYACLDAATAPER
jgi:ABC-type sugar transport system ATPase subunit